jgi:hypothetical protein
MTREELLLMKELIKETVRSVVKEVLTEDLSTSLKKDMKDVKKLLVKSIQEGYTVRNVGNSNVDSSYSRTVNREKLREIVGGDISEYRRKPEPIPGFRISEEQGMQISQNGTLPDIDAPIPMIDKNSIVWKDLKDKLL